MDTARYQAFLTAAETGSIKNAAEELGYTPSGVSQLIKALEEELGFTLLYRSKKGVSLTQEGRRLRPTIREILGSESRLFQTASEMRGLSIGDINIAAYHCLAAGWMPSLISGFQKKYPNIRIQLFEGTQQDILQYLDDRMVNLAFFNCADTINYDWLPLMKDRMVAVLPKDHPMAEYEVFPLEAFRDERFIMPEHGQDQDVLDMLDEVSIKPNIYLSTFDSFTAVAMIEKGLGISIMNELSIPPGNNRDIVTLPTVPEHFIEMGIALPSITQASPAVKKFISYAVESGICRANPIGV